MIKYVLKRLLITIPILLCVIFIVFSIMQLTPGDPATSILGATATPEQIAQLNHELDYDQPFFTRFFNYVIGVLHGDFGTSYRTNQPVISEIKVRFPTTFKLAMLSMLISATIGITLGIISAVKQYSPLDTTLTVLALLFAAIPGFWLGLMLIWIFAVTLGVLPTSGADSWKSLILPLVTLSAGGIASLLRITRSAMLETIRQDYIRTARAKGASERVVILRHALKNALLPVITVLGMNFSGMLGGAVIAETVFSMPGIGQYIITGIRQKNDPVVLSCTLMLASLFCIIMLLIDIIYGFVDPRVKARFAPKKR